MIICIYSTLCVQRVILSKRPRGLGGAPRETIEARSSLGCIKAHISLTHISYKLICISHTHETSVREKMYSARGPLAPGSAASASVMLGAARARFLGRALLAFLLRGITYRCASV